MCHPCVMFNNSSYNCWLDWSKTLLTWNKRNVGRYKGSKRFYSYIKVLHLKLFNKENLLYSTTILFCPFWKFFRLTSFFLSKSFMGTFTSSELVQMCNSLLLSLLPWNVSSLSSLVPALRSRDSTVLPVCRTYLNIKTRGSSWLHKYIH